MKVTKGTIAAFTCLLLFICKLSAQTPPALPPLPAGEQLDAWRFQDTNWLSVFDDAPLSFTNLVLEEDWAGNGLLLDDTNAAYLNYAVVSPDGWTNITFSRGSVSFWFSPDWNTSDGIGNWGTLLEVGSWSTNTTGAWGLYISPDGANLYFSAQTNGFSTNYLNAPIAWNAGDWHQITLTYTATNSALYLEGQLVTNGPGVNVTLDAALLTNGFSVGSDGNATGLRQARGLFNELETFDYPLDPISISNNYAWVSQNVYPLPSSGFHHDTSPTVPGDGGDYTNGPTGDLSGFPAYGSNDFWIQGLQLGTNAYTTNPGTLTLLVHGTVADIAYDLFSTTNIQTTNTIWTYVETVIGSEITNLTPAFIVFDTNQPTLFFRALASTLDSDGDGLPDWWEQKYSTTGFPLSSTNADTGDTGIQDGYKQDSAGDGYNNLQKYQLGIAPGTWVTPQAPSGFNAVLSTNGMSATLTWNPSPGSVQSYTIYVKNDTNYAGFVTLTNLSASQTSFTDNSSTFSSGIQYEMQVNYTGGSSAVTGQSDPAINPAWAMPLYLSRGALGQLYLAASAVPNGVTAVRVNFNLFSSTFPLLVESANQPVQTLSFGSATGSFDVPVTNLENGLYAIPTNQIPLYGSYTFDLQAVGVDGRPGPHVSASPLNPISPEYYDDNRFLYLPFMDGRSQISQNVDFQLRAASGLYPCTISSLGTFPSGEIAGPNYFLLGFTNYVYAGFTHENNQLYNRGYPTFDFYVVDSGTLLDEFQPFVDNSLFQNFLYNPSGSHNLDFGIYDGETAQSMGGVTYDFSQFDNGNLAVIQPTNLFNEYSYITTSNLASVPTLLDFSGTPCIFTVFNTGYYDEPALDGAFLTEDNYFQIPSGFKNFYGLAYQSTEWGYYQDDTGALIPTNTAVGGLVTSPIGPWFHQVTTPSLTSNSYYFARAQNDLLPGQSNFSLATESPLLIAGFGHQFFVTAWAKQSLANSSSNVFAYAQQYFDKAYAADTNGTITTNSAGILSEYGEFFPTQPGKVFLTTKPDGALGTVGTNVVNVIKLQLDVNHDGTMDLSFAGPDNTSADRPFVFWVNDDDDEPGDGIRPDKDVDSAKTPDYGLSDYTFGKPYIHSQRDLEDYARLWIYGVPALTNGDCTVTMFWTNIVSGNPSIILFQSVETNGGIGYLTDTNTASSQILQIIGTGGYMSFIPGPGLAIAIVSNTFTFPTNFFTNGLTKYLLFEGAGVGNGELVINISRSGTNIASTSAFLDLHDVKSLYERASAQNVTSELPPSSLTSTMQIDNTLPADPTEAKQLIIFAHGMNQTDWEYLSSSATMFKRLYWAGFKGRFAAFRWPCGFLPPRSVHLWAYDNSEFFAWKSAPAFKDYMTYLRGNTNRLAGYSLNIIAHSQGNIMVSEALKERAPFDNYILTQAAAPAHSYDTDTNDVPFLEKLVNAETIQEPTPFVEADGGYQGYFTNISGTLINFFNTSDFALATGTTLGLPTNWEENQFERKPEHNTTGLPWGYIFDPSTHSTIYYDVTGTNSITDGSELKSMVARSRSHAIGAQNGAKGAIKSTLSVDLFSQFGFGNTRPDHSGQFTRNEQIVNGYYGAMLDAFNIR